MINVLGVKSFVGCDAHSKTCFFEAIDADATVLRKTEVATDIIALQKALRGLPRPIWLLVESCPMAAFVADALQSVIERIIVCETRVNRWITCSEDKSDPNDADRLARLLRMGECKPVYFPCRKDRDLQELVRFQRKSTDDVIKNKNRIKDVYRRLGVHVTGKTVFHKNERSMYLVQVEDKTLLFKLKMLYEKLDSDTSVKEQVERRLHLTLSRRRVYRQLKMIPGIGPILAAVIIAVIADPLRFPTKRKLWKYAGLSVRRPWSSQVSLAKEGGSKGGNRLLKYAAMEAARFCQVNENRFSLAFDNLLSNGVKPEMAQRTIARKILATVLAMWKNGTEYCDSQA